MISGKNMVGTQTHAMVVTPHPDDAEFGVAGTVTNWTRQGKQVVYAVCTNGDKGTSDPNMDPQKLAQIREEEQLAAAKILGVKEVIFLRHPDQGLEDTPEFRKEIVRLIQRYRPEIVVTADPYRRYLWHRDHRIAAQVTLDAVFPLARTPLSYPDLLQEGLSPHAVREVWCWGAEEADYCSDITGSFDIKIEALACHKTQTGNPFPDEMRERLRKRATKMAEREKFELGEEFRRVKMKR